MLRLSSRRIAGSGAEMTCKRSLVMLVLLAFVILSTGLWMVRQLDIDGCLDAGGRWNYVVDGCELS